MLNINGEVIEFEVVHVKSYGTKNKKLDDGAYIYCGRPSLYSNPYFLKSEDLRIEVIQRYSEDPNCQSRIRKLKNSLSVRDFKMVKLGCYCAPKACHCDVIKKELEKC